MDTIHQIWIGDNPLPTPWTDTVKEFAQKYNYTYKLWTDSSVKDIGMDEIPGLKALYTSFGGELAGRADILRLLILYKYGGIYIDADTVIMKAEKFDRFLKKNTKGIFFGWENLTPTRTRKLGLGVRRLVANGIIGAEKGHPFLKRLLDGIVDHSANITDTKDVEKFEKLAKEALDVKFANINYQNILLKTENKNIIYNDNQDGILGTKKIISDIFTTSSGTINVSKLRAAKNKINN
jgi:hypothetical protein